MGVRGRKRERKHNRKRWIIAIVVSFVVLVVGSAGFIYLKLNANISTFDSAGISKDRPPAAKADANGDKAVNVLLIGSDTRSGENGKLGGSGSGAIGRSDTTILLHVYPDHKHAVGISIPRDSLVEIPPCLLPDGTWTKDKPSAMFNSAFSVGSTAKGNPACTQNTVEKLSGLRVDHTMVVDFAGFASMTSAVHGVEVCVPNNIYQGDLNPNLGRKGNVVLKAGMQNLSGQDALDYVRVRHGVGDNSDVGRMLRQQAFLSALISKVKGQGMNPTTLLPLANAATKSLTVDPGIGSARKLLSFGMSLKNIDLKNIQFITAPWKYAGARIDLVHPDVDDLFAELRADRTLDGVNASGKVTPKASASATPAKVDGTGITVSVYNGTTKAGLAGQAADTLKSDDFTVMNVTNARTRDHAVTRIEYGASGAARAKTVAKLFPGAQLVQLDTTGVNIVLGQDYATSSAKTPTSTTPTPLPTSVSKQARSAADDPCSKLSYG